MQRPPSITSNETLLNYLKGLENRVNKVENKGTGTIGFLDEATGVETIIGKLPDGSVGVGEWINDTTPPEQPSSPVVTAGVGFLRVAWNGLDILDGAPPKDYDKTIVEKSENGTDGWVAVEELRGNSSANVGGVSNSVPTYFRLVSVDKNGNRSTPSSVASGTALYETPETTQAIADAIEAAQNADDLASSKIKVYFQAASPALTGNTFGDTWFDTDEGNKVYVWTGSAWTSAQDAKIPAIESLASSKIKSYVQATSPALTGNTFGDTWYDTSQGNKIYVWTGSAWTSAQDAKIPAIESLASSKIKTYFQASSPALTGNTFGDVWFDTDDGNKVHVWNGSAWTSAQDAKIPAIETLASSKIRVYHQAASPALTGNTFGDTWYDSDDGNKPYVWTGSAWTNAQDQKIIAVDQVATSKTKTFFQTTSPATTGRTTGDTWFDTDDGNRIYVWNGSAWTDAQDDAIAAAQQAAVDANSLASSKIKVYYQANSPALTGNTFGDTWFDTDAGNKPYVWNGSAWSSAQDASIAAANTLASSKTKTYYQTSTPPTTDRVVGDTWFDTDDGNKIYVWNGSAWTSAQDAAIVAANDLASSKIKVYFQTAQPAVTGNTFGDTWFDTDAGNKVYVWNGSAWTSAQDTSIATAQSTANTALTSANGKNKVYFQAASPALTGNVTGDTWFDTDDGNKIYVWNGSAWTDAQDDAIAAAQTAANTAIQNAATADSKAVSATNIANSKNVIISATSAPATAGRIEGDTWFDTDDGNKPYIFNGTAWVSIQDASIATAQGTANSALTTANGKTKTYFQAASPALTGNTTGDIWFDTDDGNKVYVWNGSAWTSARDSEISTALTSANGKNRNYYQNDMPSGGTYILGDTWFDTNDGNKIYVYNGSTFVSAQDTAISTAQTTANAKTKTYFQTAQPGTTGNTTGDIWFDTDDGNKVYVWNGSAWTNAQDLDIQKSISGTHATDWDINQANKWAYTKYVKTTSANTIPDYSLISGMTGVTTLVSDAASLVSGQGDNYIGHLRTIVNIATAKTIAWTMAHDDGSRVYLDGVSVYSAGVYTSNASVSFSISAGWHVIDILWAEQAGGDGITAFTPLLSTQVTNMYAPVSLTDAASTATAALTSANGKNKVIWSTDDATGTTGYSAGDVWFKRDGTGAIIAQWEFTTSWQSRTVAEAVLGNLSAGKITSGTIAADRIGASTISASKLFVGDFTNLASDGNFTDTTKANWTGSGSVTVSAGGPNLLQVTTASSGNNDALNRNSFQVTAGEQIYGEVWVYGAPTNVGGGGPNIHLQLIDNNGAMSWPGFNSSTRAAVSGQWLKLSGTITIPANTKSAKVELAVNYSADAVGNIYYFREVSVRRKTSGNLIVDGAIQANSAIIATGAIGNAHIGDLAVGTAEIQNAAITSAKIEDLAVTDAKIANATITNAKIANLDAAKITSGTIDAGRIGADSITGGHIAGGTITAAELAAGSITASAIASQSITATALAAESITATAIAADTITAGNIKAGAITGSELAAGSVSATAIAANSITATALAAQSITATALAAQSITATALGANSITATAIAADSIRASAIRSGEITAAHLTAGSITASALAAGSITATALNVNVGGNQLVTNSSFEVDSNSDGLADSWAVFARGTGDAGRVFTNSRVAGHFPGSTWAQKVVTTTATNTNSSSLQGTQLFPIAPGVKVTVSLYARADSNQNFTIGMRCEDDSAAYIGEPTFTAALTTTAQRFSGTLTIPAGTTKARVTITGPTSPANGSWFESDGVKVEIGDIVSAWSPLSSELLPGTIVANMLAANSVTAQALAAGSITATAIAAQTVTASALAAGSITATALAADSITATAIAANAVTAQELAAGSITATAIAAGSITASALSAQSITATALGAQSVSATAIAAQSITATALAAQSITATALAAQSITASAIKSQTITATALAANSITATAIGAQQVTAAKLLVADMEELIPNPNFHPSGEPVVAGTVMAAASTVVSAGAPSTYVLKLSQRDTIPFATANIACKPGDQFYVEAQVCAAPTVTRVFNHYLFVSNQPVGGLSATLSSSKAVTGTWTKHGWAFTIPAGYSYFKPVLQVETVGGDTVDKWEWYVTQWSLKRKNTAELIVDGSIQANHIKAANITASALAAGSITATALAAQSITATAMAAQSITATAIAAQSISATALAAQSITATAIAANSITASALAAGSITATAIAAGSITATAIAAQSITATALAANSITATAIGAQTIGAEALKAGSITATALAADSITATAIGAQQVTATELAANSITATAIAAGSITASALAAQSITATALGAGSITATAIGAQSITATAIAGQSITATALAAQSITASAIAAGSITATALAANSITATAISGKTITADKLVLTSTDNLVMEADFGNNGASWQLTPAYKFIMPDRGRGGLPALRIVGSTSEIFALNLANRIKVDQTNRYRAAFWIRSTEALAAGKAKLYLRCYTDATAYTDIVAVSSPELVVDTWTQVKGVSPALPAGTVAIEVIIAAQNSATETFTEFDYVSVTRAADAQLIVDGSVTAAALAAQSITATALAANSITATAISANSVTADKLETDLVLASKIIAGDPAGTRAEMAPTGFRVLAREDPDDPLSPVSEVVRMGDSTTNDYFAIVKTDGTLAASMSEDGGISAQFASINGDIEWRGNSLTTDWDALPKGIVAWGSRSDSSPYWAAGFSFQPYLSLTFDAVAGRAYRVWTTPIQMAGDTTTAFPMANLHYGVGSTINTSTAKISQLIYDYNGIAADRRNTLTFERLVTPSTTGAHSLLISYGAALSNGGQGKIISTGASSAVIMVVEDIGLAPAETGESPNGSADGAPTNPAPPPAKINYVKTYYPTATQSFTGTGAQYEYNTSYMYSGLSPAGYGDLRSMAMFSSQIATDVGAGTITKVRVYAYYDHWYYNSGGTADITLYAGTSIPGTLPTVSGTTIASTGWPKPGGRWVTLNSATFASIKAGTARGIMFGGKGRGYLGYGYLHDVRLEVSYTK